MARNPLKFRFLGLFEIDRFAAFAMLNSLLSHIIVLIQYDMENI